MELLTDARRSVRALVRQAGFSVPVVATLSLALGAMLTIFGVVRGVILRQLPYPDSQRIVSIDHAAPGIGAARGLQMTAGIFEHYRDHARGIEHLAVWTSRNVNLVDDRAPERVEAVATTWTLASALGVSPRLGRFLEAGDDVVPGNAAVVLTHGLWMRRFGGDRTVIGRTVLIDGVAFRVSGVMPEGFAFPSSSVGLLMPMRIDAARSGFGGFSLNAVARLAAGATPDLAQRELENLIGTLPAAWPGPEVEQLVTRARLAPLVSTLHAVTIRDVSRLLWLILGAVLFVLLIASANVVNLFMVRAASRQREAATRIALGASRAHMLRLVLTESACLAAVALFLALMLSVAGISLVRILGPQNLPRLDEVRVDAMVVVVGAGLAFLASIGLGLTGLPSRRPVADALREGRILAGGRAAARARNALAAGQVALAIVLLVGAGLLVRSHGALRRVDRGYTADGVLTFELGLPRLAYPTREAATRAHNEILTRVRALPGVTSAGATTCLPLCGSWAGEEWRSPERPTPPGENPPIGATRRISAGYLETLRLRLVAGRYLTAEDEAARSGAAVVSEQLAARLWPGEDPIGRHLYHGMPARPQDWYTVVGVVANTAVRELTDQPVSMAYLPLLHVDSTEGPAPYLMSVVLRTSVPPASVVDAARGAVLAIDPTLPMARVRTMQSIVVSAESRTAFARTMLLVAAAVALFLGVIGTYGVLAWVVNRRRPEFGIRMALGARPADISRLVAAHSIRIVGSGLAIGVVMAAMVTRLMTALLHGVTPLDPIAFGMSVALLMAAGAAATWLPARRASLVSPVEALKSD